MRQCVELTISELNSMIRLGAEPEQAIDYIVRMANKYQMTHNDFIILSNIIDISYPDIIFRRW